MQSLQAPHMLNFGMIAEGGQVYPRLPDKLQEVLFVLDGYLFIIYIDNGAVHIAQSPLIAWNLQASTQM